LSQEDFYFFAKTGYRKMPKLNLIDS